MTDKQTTSTDGILAAVAVETSSTSQAGVAPVAEVSPSTAVNASPAQADEAASTAATAEVDAESAAADQQPSIMLVSDSAASADSAAVVSANQTAAAVPHAALAAASPVALAPTAALLSSSETPHVVAAAATPRALPPTPVLGQVLDDVGSGEYQGPLQSGGYTDDQTPTLSGADATPGNLIKIYDNDRLIGSVLVKANGTWLFNPTTPLLEGQHSLVITATDRNSGAESAPSQAFSIFVDLTPPSAVASLDSLSNEQNPLTTTDHSPTLFGSLSAPLAANEKLQISLDGGQSWADVSAVSGNHWQYQDLRQLPNGTYSYELRAIDAAGNEGVGSTQQITVNGTVPLPQIDVQVAGIDPDTGAQGDFITSASKISLFGTLSQALPSGAKLQVSVDGGQSWQNVGTSGTDWSYADLSTHALGSSTHYQFHVVDANGQELPGSQAARDVAFFADIDASLSTSFDMSSDTAVAIVGDYSNAQSATNHDFITRDQTLDFSGKLSSALQVGQALQVSLDGGQHWQTILANGGQLWSYAAPEIDASQALGVSLRVIDAAGASLDLGTHQVLVDLDSPAALASMPQLPGYTAAGQLLAFSSDTYGVAESGATVALVEDVNFDGRYDEGLDKVVGYAVADAAGKWNFAGSLKAGEHQLGFVTWDQAGNNSGFGPQVLTYTLDPTSGIGATTSSTTWGGTVYSVRGSDTAAMALSADGTWSFFQSAGYALNSTCYTNSGYVYSGIDQTSYHASYLAEPKDVTACGDGHMLSNATFVDYNRDGLMDVFAMTSGTSYTLPVWTANADGSYSAGSLKKPKDLNVGGIIAWDAQGDGYTDLIYVDNQIGEFGRINNNGGKLSIVADAKSCWFGGEISGVDIDNSGSVDLAGHNDQYGSTALGVLLNKGDGSFAREQEFANVFYNHNADDLKQYSNVAVAMTWADFNGDGYLDLFLAQGATGSTGWTGNSDDSRIYLNKGVDASGKWLGMDTSKPLFFGDAIGIQQKNGMPFHFDGGPSFAVDWNHDGKVDVIEVPRQNAEWSQTNGNMAPVLYLNDGKGGWYGSGQAMTGQVYGNITGAVAVDYDWDGAVDLLMYRTAGVHKGSVTDSAPTILVHNDNAVVYGTSLTLRILDKNGMDSFFGNTVKLYDSKGHLVATEVINPQSSVTSDSSGLLHFYGLDANEVYSAQLLRTENGLSSSVGAMPVEGGTLNHAWGGLTTGTASHAYVLTAEADGAVNSTLGAGMTGSGYDDSFFATEGNDAINGGGGWNLAVDGSRTWSATGGMDVVDYGMAKNGVQVNLQSGVSVGMGNDLLKNIEGLKGSAFADAFSDNASANQFEGRGGNDVIYLGNGGHDTLIYRAIGGDATGGNGHDSVYGFSVGNTLSNANADVIDMRGLLAYGGPVNLIQDGAVTKLDASSQGLLNFIKTSVVGNDTLISVDRDGAGTQVGAADLVTLVGVKTDLLSLLQNHQMMV
ncbi:VCBS repeat-containing protein [Pseudomonas panipatensis]|uniref:Repeat domain-containing protein n=1 Tax=Pseudomonas panipatensis TaxID=428992 RepID=A0A1G8FJ84_9PSED|nr:VCBS repeat-containing protein [Pseudomonas panipatensis]SDH82210.1 Repeat domain-containing protein [Pseudomonas panipatensis]SMP53296.1 Repeat domain-containing protein [Pseudomonas panipatensis]